MTSLRTLARRAALPVVLSVAAITTGCLGTTDLPEEAKIETTTFDQSLGVDLAHSIKLESGVVIRDITVGTGDAAVLGDSAIVSYAGFLPSGFKFDPQTGTTSDLRFLLGSNDIIAGFQLGVVGMKVGGSRQIIIPPSLAYGYNGNGPIPGNSVILFNVQLNEIK